MPVSPSDYVTVPIEGRDPTEEHIEMASGWISRRFMRNRAKWGSPVSEEKRRAPLRRIAAVIRHRDGMFDCDGVLLECGHTADAWGSVRARCVSCAEKAGEGGFPCAEKRKGPPKGAPGVSREYGDDETGVDAGGERRRRPDDDG
jgi:hypothetical protein